MWRGRRDDGSCVRAAGTGHARATTAACARCATWTCCGRRACCGWRCAGSPVRTGVVSEELPFARSGSRFTRAFEDTCVWLARDAPKTVVARLLRVDWATGGRRIERVVAEATAASGEQ